MDNRCQSEKSCTLQTDSSLKLTKASTSSSKQGSKKSIEVSIEDQRVSLDVSSENNDDPLVDRVMGWFQSRKIESGYPESIQDDLVKARKQAIKNSNLGGSLVVKPRRFGVKLTVSL